MSVPPSFHLPTTPLAPGVCVVEASAGTGKTFTIAGLFLRLILEWDFSVREILVVTFTEAATEELRERIRHTLVDALRVLDGGVSENPAVAEIVAQNTERAETRPAPATLRSRLERALRAFDEAPICTIHSFCQRTLRDHAFESGALFDTDLVTDDTDLLQAVADDYWRRQFYNADPLLVSAALQGKLSPEGLATWLRLHSRHPLLQVISSVDDRPLETLVRALQQAFDDARAQWRAHHDEIRACFRPTAPWAKGKHGDPAEAAAWLEQLERCFSDRGPTPEALAILRQFTPEQLQENTRAKKQAPEHDFFRRCGDFCAAHANYLVGLRLDFLTAARDALRLRKQELKVQSFDDLLTGLLGALRGRSGSALIAEVRRKFRAALIDEFQDTDPVQWAVFRALFGAPDESGTADRERGKARITEDGKGGKGERGKGSRDIQTAESPLPPISLSPLPGSTPQPLGPGSVARPSLFLIGDPKQAIYGFRGADIFTYLDAARTTKVRYTLDRNWRSESGLVGAVNTLFGASPNPFAFGDIAFQKIHAAGKADEEPLLENGERSPPLRLWFMPREADQKEISKGFAEGKLPGVVATEIVRLLNGGVMLGARRLAPRDIAVLVPENRQAALMQEALRRVSVPSVLYTEESIFDSREAVELEHVLAALSQPGHERALRAALTTDLMGVSGTELEAMAGDEATWQSWLETARAHYERWLDLGFMPMFRRWLQAGQVRRRLLAFEDGERRLTNLLHLAETLHAAAQEHRFGPAPLARWLAEQISASDRAGEEHQLRLERDDEAVRLVTIHKSKGLEYPVVFCPFSWKSSEPTRRGENEVLFHVTPTPALTPTPTPTLNLTLTPNPTLSESSESESKSMSKIKSKSETEDGRLSQFVLDLGSPEYDAHRRLAFREKLAENLRLLYVALTRARNRCYFVWGAFRGAGTSAAAWLLHRPQTLGEDWQESMTAHFKTLADVALHADLLRLADLSTMDGAPTIEVEHLPQAASERYRPQAADNVKLSPRGFTGFIPTNWRITSFSGLVAASADELPDHDSETRSATQLPSVVGTVKARDGAPDFLYPLISLETSARDHTVAATSAPAAPTPLEGKGIFAFPRGTRAGTCLHHVLEELDFTQTDDAGLRSLVESKLRLHGIPANEFAPTVCDAVRRATSVPLASGRQDFTLSRVARSERLNELEFFLPVRELTPALLRHGLSAVGQDAAARLGALGFKPAGGFLKGFIDLVFRFEGRYYIVDWKSNWLGPRVEDYGLAAMRAEMERKFYFLQAHLYAVALHEYLRLRLPGYRYEEHFGGVRYVFLRGLDPERPELGVFRDRPEAGTIETLAEALRHGERASVTSQAMERRK
jgi:exodeoxyribonuclease V beta subunit